MGNKHKTISDIIKSISLYFATQPAFTVCLEDGRSKTLTFKEIDDYSDYMAVYLKSHLKLPVQSRIAVQMPNNLSYPLVTFAIIKAGYILVNMNPMYTTRESVKQINDSQSKVLICLESLSESLLEIKKLSTVEHIVVSNQFDFTSTINLPEGLIALQNALDVGQKSLQELDTVSVESIFSDDIALLQYTGGTTGISKGTEITHHNLVSNIKQLQKVIGNDVLLKGKETILTVLPLYHIFSFTFNMLLFFSCGAHNILIPSPRPLSNLKQAFLDYKITFFTAVNVLLNGLCYEYWFTRNPPKHLKLTVSGGTSLHLDVAKRWSDITNTPVCEGYGLTEASPVVSINPPKAIKFGSIGLPLDKTEIRIIDSSNKIISNGDCGELVVKGPQVSRGYWRNIDQTEKTFIDGWLYTGDIAYRDRDGYIFVVDRKKDMIDVNGFNVYPNEIESIVGEHPDIIEVAVIGVPCKVNNSEKVVAYLVSKNKMIKEKDITDFIKDKLTAYKRPKEIIFMDELPKSAVGKILRRVLREKYT